METIFITWEARNDFDATGWNGGLMNEEGQYFYR